MVVFWAVLEVGALSNRAFQPQTSQVDSLPPNSTEGLPQTNPSLENVSEEGTQRSHAELPRELIPTTITLTFLSTAGSSDPGTLVIYRLTGDGDEVIREDWNPRDLVWQGEIFSNAPTEIAKPDPGEYLFVARVPGHLVAVFLERIGPDHVEIIHSLTPTEWIVCAVLTEGGVPVEGAEVRMLPSQKLPVINEQNSTPQVGAAAIQVETSNHNGIVTFRSPCAQLSRLHIIPPAPFAERIVWDVEPGAHIDAIVVPGASVIGQVKDPGSLPIEGVAVTVYIKEALGPEVPIGSSYSDKEGRFILEKMDPSAKCWSVFAEKAGWEMSKKEVLNPVAGSVYPINFTVSRAVEGSYRLVARNGEEVAGIGLHLLGTGSSEVPFSWVTDSRGQFRTGKYLVVGATYSLQCVIGGIVQNISQITAIDADSTGPVRDVYASNLGKLRLASLEMAQGIEEIELELVGTVPPMIAKWNPPYALLWLPSGEYLATGFGSGTILSQRRIVIEAQGEAQLDLSLARGLLRFSVSEVEAGLTVSILSHSNIVVWEQTCGGGEYAAELPVGQYYFSCSSSVEGAWDTPVFSVIADGTDYGLLDPAQFCRAAIQGSVVSEVDAPISSALIMATSSDGYRSVKTLTDESGLFSLSGLPLGKYEVVCDLYQGTGMARPAIRRAIVLDGSRDQYSMTFVLPSKAVVAVRVPSDAASANYGFLLDHSNVQFASIGGGGIFRVFPSDPRFTVGVCYSPGPGALNVLAAKLEAGVGVIDLADECVARQRISIQSAPDGASSQIRAYIESNGIRVGQAAFTEGGRLDIEFSLGSDFELVLIADSGPVWRLPLSGSREIELDDPAGKPKGWFAVATADHNGKVRASVYVACCDLRLQAIDEQQISTRCNRQEHDIIVDAPGYMGVRRTISVGTRVILLQSAALKRVDLSQAAAGANSLRIREVANGKEVAMLLVGANHTADLPELPIGAYEFDACDSKGNLLLTWTIVLAATGPTSTRF